MNRPRSLLLRLASILATFAFIVLTTSQSEAVTQQMGDMPYDLHFIDMMIMHHQEGVEMAQLAQTQAVSAKVKAFATKQQSISKRILMSYRRIGITGTRASR